MRTTVLKWCNSGTRTRNGLADIAGTGICKDTVFRKDVCMCCGNIQYQQHYDYSCRKKELME